MPARTPLDYWCAEPKVGGSNPSRRATPASDELAGGAGSATLSLPPTSAPSGHELEQHLRTIVLGGLWPLVDVLVRGEPAALRCSVADGDALVALGLAVPDHREPEIYAHGLGLDGALVLTDLAVEVQQQLAVLRYEGCRPEPYQASAWRDVLLVAGQPTDRGERLLEWLRLGTPESRCYACDAAATGLCTTAVTWDDSSDNSFGPYALREANDRWVLACSRHRVRPQWWRTGALDQHLAGVPSCASIRELEEVGHE